MNYDALENTDVSGNGAGKIKHVGLLADKTLVISAVRLITTWVDREVNIFYTTSFMNKGMNVFFESVNARRNFQTCFSPFKKR